jgi:hypothetical protein
MKNLLKLLPLAAISCMMVGCTNNDNAYDADAIANQKKAEYTAAFQKEFGTIASNQDWGFSSATSSANAFMTRTANKNTNQWFGYVDAPGGYDSNNMPKGDVTQAEIDSVKDVFSKVDKSDNAINLNWSDFFIQHVYTSKASYKDGNNNPVTGNAHMDYLTAGASDDHANDFNSSTGGIILMQNSSTSRFGYRNSTDGNMHYEYIIKEINGNYYVGFDFYANGSNPNQKVERDYIYDDWIVKISPATYKNASRIIAEDLGSIGDFDFNDVVFDVVQVDNATVITVRAAGGTLPLYIKVDNTEKEVHEALGVTTSTMVNTNNGSVSKPIAIFRLPAYTTDLDNGVVVYVKNGSSDITLTTETGGAPAKIRVKTSYQWTNERQSIKDKYPQFAKYVSNPTISWY